ncbi:hypothetical protein WR25_00234 [Diploscapter pachys]|uniref:Uncharacterized protein n=1 Tax=Diploscapter pachys TaxID=2018661 RepID=A0A2A2K2V2_9BILA|nr:hypothetical protein [Sphingomonas melonis]AOW23937.1 hypothetical protein BJP26_10400 [Sphingomonas melonis TY]PAV68241.1 hypothetical protein WR25_00234 [Diploscapter pachys]
MIGRKAHRLLERKEGGRRHHVAVMRGHGRTQRSPQHRAAAIAVDPAQKRDHRRPSVAGPGERIGRDQIGAIGGEAAEHRIAQRDEFGIVGLQRRIAPRRGTGPHRTALPRIACRAEHQCSADHRP